MSTNTTNTNDRVAVDIPASAPAQETGAEKYGGVSAATPSLPDMSVIAKLANEFFAARTGKSVPENSDPADQYEIADAPPAQSTSTQSNVASWEESSGQRGGPWGDAQVFPHSSSLESFSFPVVPPASAGGVPSSPPAGPLGEADFRAIAASLAGITALVPHPAETAPQPEIPGKSSNFAEGEKGDPWRSAPVFSPAIEMYSFPGVPIAPQSGSPSASDLAAVTTTPAGAASGLPTAPAPPTTASSSGSKPDATRSDPWTITPFFPAVNELTAFPRAPGVSAQGVPDAVASPPSVPKAETISSPIAGLSPSAAPAVAAPPVAGPTASMPQATSAPADAVPNTPFTSAIKVPAASELISFPGVPGAQSFPGTPVLPASVPAKLPSETDLQSLAGSSTTFPATHVPGTRPSGAQDANATRSGRNAPANAESMDFSPEVVPSLGVPKRPLDPRLIRKDFPILEERVHGRQLIWLDNAATTQKPNAVIDRLSYFYQHENSNIHRAAHTLAARATDAYESAREKTRHFINASTTREIIFVRGATEGINLVAQSWGRRNIEKDDEIVITWLEHHANIVPWQQLCAEKGARLRVAPVNDRGEIILEQYERLMSSRTKLVSFSQVSNALGTITPAREMVEIAHRYGARVLVDGAQSVSHIRADVQALNCDFYVFSGHKVFGPTGIGVVYGKLEVLDHMPPWQGGGNMIVDVTFEKTVYQAAPARFEAGTGNIADAVGLGAALDYVEQIGIENIAAYEHELLNYATAGLLTVPGLRLIGTAREKAGVLSFVLDDIRTEDVGVALNEEGIAVRSGHHCAQPILRRFGLESTVRPSLAFYNTCEEIDALVAALLRIQAGRGHRN